MNLFNVSALFFSFCTFLIGFLVYFKRQDEIGRKWLLFCLTASLWGFLYSLWAGNYFDLSTSMMWMKMSHVCSIFIPVTWTHFVFTFIGISREKRGFLKFLYTLSFLLSFTVLTPYFFSTPVACFPFKYYPQPGPLYHLFSALFFGSVGYAFLKAIAVYRKSFGEKRRELKYLIGATGIGFTGGALTFLPVYGVCFPQYNLLLMPLYPFIMAYAITRHRVLDLEEIIQAAHRDKLAALGMLAASVNHEIRNPLYIVKAYTERLLGSVRNGSFEKLPSEERNHKVEEVLEKVTRQMGRAVEMTEKITGFSKPSTDTLEKIHLNEPIESVLSFIGYGLERDNIQIEKKLDLNSPIHANRKEMEQIFLNLIMNASQAMPQGGLLTLTESQHNGRIQVDISDTGEGISLDHLKRVFEPFFTTKKDEGTGLGLYIVKKLVERNRGKIKVASEAGKGTTFTLEFSIAE